MMFSERLGLEACSAKIARLGPLIVSLLSTNEQGLDDNLGPHVSECVNECVTE